MSLAMITEKDIEVVKIALNDSISDIDKELKEDVTGRKRVGLLDYKDKYLKVCNKLRQNPSIYSLNETELDIAAGGLNDAIQLLDDILESGELDELETKETIASKDECSHLVELLAGWFKKTPSWRIYKINIKNIHPAISTPELYLKPKLFTIPFKIIILVVHKWWTNTHHHEKIIPRKERNLTKTIIGENSNPTVI